ncbi:MAG: ATP-binding protein [Candidatus Falkowbacteria bacterium]
MKIIDFLKKQITPKSNEENIRRQEYILNIIIVFSLISFSILNLIRIIDYIIYVEKRGLPLGATIGILIFLFFLLYLSRRGNIKAAASFLLIAFSLPMFYSFFIWGADLPAGLLLAVLIITISGILLGDRLAFISTTIITLFIIILTYLQGHKIIGVQYYWRSEPAQIGDAISYAVLLFIIAVVAWLFIRTINQSLSRARESEKLLREERDSLEIKVEARTKEIKELQAEKINQLYRLAEFGRLSSGIFHDLINPLTAVSLNLEQIKTETDSKIISAKSYLGQALLATNKMESLIASIKKQISRENVISVFSLNQEINQTIQILSYKSRRADVNINFKIDEEITMRGDALKFGQVIANLLANAIDACENSKQKEISIELSRTNKNILIRVVDSGAGIRKENLNKIFEPFFSTKKQDGHGLGLGLATSKNIVEADFAGKIAVVSEQNVGTSFIINIPTQND